jgi:hypothetical protein
MLIRDAEDCSARTTTRRCRSWSECICCGMDVCHFRSVCAHCGLSALQSSLNSLSSVLSARLGNFSKRGTGHDRCDLERRTGGWARDAPLPRHSRPSTKSTSHIVATATDLPQISFDDYARYMISDAHVIANAWTLRTLVNVERRLDHEASNIRPLHREIREMRD